MISLEELGTDLFSDQLPSLEELCGLGEWVNSAALNKVQIAKELEEKASNCDDVAVGIGLYIVGQYEQAVEKLQKSRDCQEKFLYLGYALAKLDNVDESIKAFDKAVKHNADAVTTGLAKAEVYRAAKQLDKAEKELEQCSGSQATNAEYNYQLGRCQAVQGLYEEAMASYDAAQEISPGHQSSLFHLAYLCDVRGDEEAAIDYYKQLSSQSPIAVNALMNLAVLYEDAGEFEKSAMCIEKVLKYHPNHERAALYMKDSESSKTMVYDEEKEKRLDRKHQILETPITDFELSVRSRNCLKKMNIRTIGDLLNTSEAELLSYKNFGETSLKEIKAVLDLKNLRLGMEMENKGFVPVEDEEMDYSDETDEILSKPVSDLELSVRARKCLDKLALRNIGELVSKTEAELLSCKNFGVTSLNEIKLALNSLGISLRQLD